MSNASLTKSILVVEDEVVIAEHLRQILQTVPYRVEVASDSNVAIGLLDKGAVDLALLDINLETRTSGIDLANLISRNYKIPFVFVTANDEHKLMDKALEVLPASYITKPFNPMDVLASVRLALQKSSIPVDFVTVQDGSGLIRFPKVDFLYARTDGNYLQLVTLRKKYFVRATLDGLMAEFEDKLIHRIHRTCVVNLKAVQEYSLSKVNVSGVNLPLARNRRAAFIKSLSEHLQQQ